MQPFQAQHEAYLAVWVRVLLFAWIWWFTDAWLFPGDAQINELVSKPYAEILKYITIAISPIFLMFTGKSGILEFVYKKIWIIPFLSFCLLSVVWTPAKPNAIVAILNIFSLLILAAFAQKRLGFYRFINIVWSVMAAVTIISLLVIYFMPSYGLMAGVHQGKFRGLFSHKNNLGLFIAQFIVITYYFWNEIHARRIYKYIFIIISLYIMVFTQSATSLIFIFTFISTNYVVKFSKIFARQQILRFIFLIVSISLICAVFYFTYDFVLSLLDRDVTFTGRTNVWEFYYDLANKKYLVGHGFNSLETNPDLVERAAALLNFAARSPHNAYIQIFYNVGYIGLSAYFLFLLSLLLTNLMRALSSDGSYDPKIARFAFSFSVCVAAYGLVEAYQAGFNTGIPLLLVLVSHGVKRKTLQEI